MLILDSMHNLFLKHFIKSVWLNHGVLSSGDYMIVFNLFDKVVVPSDMGRIPHKIASGFSSFTRPVQELGIILLTSHYFVLACRLLCPKVITLEHAKLAAYVLLQEDRETVWQGCHNTKYALPYTLKGAST